MSWYFLSRVLDFSLRKPNLHFIIFNLFFNLKKLTLNLILRNWKYERPSYYPKFSCHLITVKFIIKTQLNSNDTELEKKNTHWIFIHIKTTWSLTPIFERIKVLSFFKKKLIIELPYGRKVYFTLLFKKRKLSHKLRFLKCVYFHT